MKNISLKSDKFKYLLSMAAVASFGITIIIALWMLLSPADIFNVQNPQGLPVSPKQVVAGEDIYIKFDYVKNKNITPEVEKTLLCNDVPVLLAGNRSLPTGQNVINVSHKIPELTPTGDNCRIYINLKYKINPLRTVSYELVTQTFSVINPVLK